MLAKILIKRRFKEGHTLEVIALLHDLRAAAISQPGYISGETLMGYDDPKTILVIGTWQDMKSWEQWKNQTRRKEFEAMIDIYLSEPAVYEEYTLGTRGA
ncbi:MAG: antibiotic biosynthesis monooxygenase [Desulfosudaceae bacterium]